MARELFGATDKSKVDATGTYHLHDVLVSEGAALVDMYAMQVDGSVEAIVQLNGLNLMDYVSRETIANGGKIDLTVNQLLVVYSDTLSTAVDDRSVQFEFRDGAGQRTWSVDARLTVVSLAFYADFDRDGQVDARPAQSKQWTWGAQGQGAVLLVNSDRDTAHPNIHFRDRRDRRTNGPLDLEDMTPVEVGFEAPIELDLASFSVRMHVSDAAASRVRIFDLEPILPEAVIGPGIPSVTWTPKRGRRPFRLEGIDFPDVGFSGLITIVCELMRTGESYGGDTLVLRVAPWLALPNTQPASTVYIAQMQDGSNKASIAGIKKVAAAAGVKLIVVPPNANRGDRWLQDEIEIGYASRPGKTLPIVLDSPRNRQLDDFPELMLLGPDFGYVTRGNDEERSSLDSFGNLDCTPPTSDRKAPIRSAGSYSAARNQGHAEPDV